MRVLWLLVLGAGCVTSDADVLVRPAPTDTTADLVALRLEPANPLATVVDGTPVEVALQAVGVRADESTAPLETVDGWSLLDEGLGTVSENGRFAAEGPRGGDVEVRARLGPDADGVVLEASTVVRVEIWRTVVAPALAGRSEALFDAPDDGDGSLAPEVLEPLPESRLPFDTAAVTIRWEPQSDVEAFLVIVEGFRVLLNYVAAPDAEAIEIADLELEALLEAGQAGPILVTVGAFAGATTHWGERFPFRFAEMP